MTRLEGFRVRFGHVLKWPRDVGPAKIVQALPLGPGSRLLVVEFGGRRVLVGQARTGLVRLADVEFEA